MGTSSRLFFSPRAALAMAADLRRAGVEVEVKRGPAGAVAELVAVWADEDQVASDRACDLLGVDRPKRKRSPTKPRRKSPATYQRTPRHEYINRTGEAIPLPWEAA